MTDFNHKMGVESIYISASLFFKVYNALEMDSLYPSAEPLYFFASVSYPGFIQQIAIIFKDFKDYECTSQICTYVHVVVNLSSQVIFVFCLGYGNVCK